MTKQEFEALPKEDQRVFLAKDVLERLNAEKITTTSTAKHFYRSNNAVIALSTSTPRPYPDGQLKEVLESLEEPCLVCARGGLFYSYIINFNEFKTPNILADEGYIKGVVSESEGRDGGVPELLERIFTKKQLAMIETAFEQDWNLNFLGVSLYNTCIEFSDGTSDEKLRAIMNNIIINKGEFIP